MTRVLYIDHPEADFLAALVYLGLARHLGPENVVDWPYKRSYHGETHRYPSVYTRDPGPSPWQTWRGAEGGDVGTTSPFAWMVAQPGKEWSAAEVEARVDEFDLVVLASPRKNNTVALAELVARVGRPRLRRLVLMDGEDYPDIHHDLIGRFAPHVYLKRELLAAAPRISPFSLATPIDALEPAREKSLDVVFLGGATWPGRESAARALQQAFGSRFVGGHVGYDEYKETLSRARIAVSVRGHGLDTLRYWEIPGFEGTMLVADRLPIQRHNDYADGEHCARFSTPEELVSVVRRYLDDEPLRARVAAAGNARCLGYHTARARARQLLSESGVG